MKRVQQAPTQHDTQTHTLRSDVLRVTSAKHQSGRRRALAHTLSFSLPVTSHLSVSSVIQCSVSLLFFQVQVGYYFCWDFLVSPSAGQWEFSMATATRSWSEIIHVLMQCDLQHVSQTPCTAETFATKIPLSSAGAPLILNTAEMPLL